MTPEELRTKITQEATATAALTRELGITVTDADATNFYASHPADFEQPEMVHVRHILLMTHGSGDPCAIVRRPNWPPSKSRLRTF